MGGEQHAVAAAAGWRVDRGGLTRKKLRERGGEALEVRRRREGDLGVGGEGQQARPLLLRFAAHPRDVADDRRGGVDQVLGRIAILGAGADGVRPARADDRRVDDEGVGPGGEDPFDAAAPLPRFDEVEQADLLELAQVVIEALPGHGHFGGQLGGGGRLAEALEQAAPDRRQGGAQAFRPVEQGDGGGIHAGDDTIEKLICQMTGRRRGAMMELGERGRV